MLPRLYLNVPQRLHNDSYLNVQQSLHNDAARRAIGTLDTPISASVETWSTHLPWNDIKQMQHLRNALSDEELCIRHMLQRPGVVPPSDVFHISFNVSISGGRKGLARIGCFTGDLRGGSTPMSGCITVQPAYERIGKSACTLILMRP